MTATTAPVELTARIDAAIADVSRQKLADVGALTDTLLDLAAAAAGSGLVDEVTAIITDISGQNLAETAVVIDRLLDVRLLATATS